MAVPVILFALLAICIGAGITVRFEGWAYSEAVERMSPRMTGIIKTITHLGDSASVILFCLLLIALTKTRKTIALPVSVAVILSTILNFVMKNIFARERPDILRLINETSYSFPSGHAMINASLYTMLALLTWEFVHNTTRKAVLTAGCIALPLAIGFSRIYLGVHYAGDILGGWLIGFAISIFVYFIWESKFMKKLVED